MWSPRCTQVCGCIIVGLTHLQRACGKGTCGLNPLSQASCPQATTGGAWSARPPAWEAERSVAGWHHTKPTWRTGLQSVLATSGDRPTSQGGVRLHVPRLGKASRQNGDHS